MSNKSNKIEVDVQDAVEDFYPGLSGDQIETIAQEIVSNWDYSQIFNAIQDDIKWYADANNIDLKGKDGCLACEEEENNVYVLNPPPSRLFPND